MHRLIVQGFSVVFAAGCGSPPVRLASPNLPVDSAPTEASSSDAEVQHVIAERLRRVAHAMAPLCGDHCGSVGAAPDSSLDSPAATLPSVRGYASLVLYDPDSVCAQGPHEELLFYCLAHEYGHHLDSTMGSDPSEDSWVREMHADAFAGCALAREGLSLEPLRIAFAGWIGGMTWIGNRRSLACGADETHPHLRWTWQAVQRGADVCAGPGATQALVLDAVQSTIEEARQTAVREQDRLAEIGVTCEGR